MITISWAGKLDEAKKYGDCLFIFIIVLQYKKTKTVKWNRDADRMNFYNMDQSGTS